MMAKNRNAVERLRSAAGTHIKQLQPRLIAFTYQAPEILPCQGEVKQASVNVNELKPDIVSRSVWLSPDGYEMLAPADFSRTDNH